MTFVKRFLEEGKIAKTLGGLGTIGALGAGAYLMSRGDDNGEGTSKVATEVAPEATNTTTQVIEPVSKVADQIKIPTGISSIGNEDFSTNLNPKELERLNYLNKFIGDVPEEDPAAAGTPSDENQLDINAEEFKDQTANKMIGIPEAGDFTPAEEKSFDKGFNIDRLNALQKAKEIQQQGIFDPQINELKEKVGGIIDQAKGAGKYLVNDITNTVKEGPIGQAYSEVKNGVHQIADKFDAYQQQLAAQEAAKAQAEEAARQAEEAAKAQAEEIARQKAEVLAADKAEVQSAEQSLRNQGIIQGMLDRRDFEAVRELVKSGDPEATKLWADWQQNLILPKEMGGEIRGFQDRYR